MKKSITASLLLLPFIACLASCEKKEGPAEDAGEKMDNVIEDVKDAVDPKGPAEKAGEKVDNALGN